MLSDEDFGTKIMEVPETAELLGWSVQHFSTICTAVLVPLTK